MNKVSRISNCKILSRSGSSRTVDLVISKGKISSIRKSSAIYRYGLNDVDAQGRIVLPSFIDCHCHLFALGEKEEEVQLHGCRSVREMVDRIRVFIDTNQTWRATGWIFGRGWDQDLFLERRMPSKEDLDSIDPDTPIVMSRICGHIAILNSKALTIFMQDRIFNAYSTELVPRDSKGDYIGLVKEIALSRCWDLTPKPRQKDLLRVFLKGQTQAVSYGLSGAHCILDSLEQLEAIRKLDQDGKLQLKLSLFLPIESLEKIERMRKKRLTNLLLGRNFCVLGFKLFTDGSLGARTAALNSDYSDESGNSGILYYSDQQVRDFARRVKRLRMVLATHAIGDRAVEQTVDAFKRAGITRRDRFRIEHSSVLRPSFLSKLSRVILSVQPGFSRSDYWIHDRIGRSKTQRIAYPFATLNKITNLVGGSDAPVESIDPILGISAAVNNRTDPSESMSLKEAIDLYTRNAAGLSPLTESSGSVTLGKSCDLVILDAFDMGMIPKSHVVSLFIGGVKVTN